MSHLDEGTLHALLDGELDTHEVAEIQAHLGACSSCGLRLREVKEFLSEADRLVASVTLDGSSASAPQSRTPIPAAPPSAPAAGPEAEARPEPPARPDPSARSGAEWEPWNEPPPPVLLVPENESASERRMRRMRRFGWAAIVMIIVGAGWVEARKMMPAGPLPADTTASRTTAVVTPEETSRPDTPVALSKVQSLANNADSVAPPPARKPASPRPAATAGTPRAAKAALPAVQDTQAKELAARDEGRSDSAAADRSADDQATDSVAPAAVADSSGTEDLATVRARASEALADLDRERRLKQAAAATAALDAQRRRNPAAQPSAASRAAQPAPAPPPAPPTLEQRAQIYLRIGLDEASRQLGGPAHVIEGLSPLFMGLVQGTAVAGADAGRPVVRVVYQDSQGRLILLDQQRLRSGQSGPPASALTWTLGSAAMWLHGEASPEILRTYRPRVR
jgi:hypothetical protein